MTLIEWPQGSSPTNSHSNCLDMWLLLTWEEVAWSWSSSGSVCCSNLVWKDMFLHKSMFSGGPRKLLWRLTFGLPRISQSWNVVFEGTCFFRDKHRPMPVLGRELRLCRKGADVRFFNRLETSALFGVFTPHTVENENCHRCRNVDDGRRSVEDVSGRDRR